MTIIAIDSSDAAEILKVRKLHPFTAKVYDALKAKLAYADIQYTISEIHYKGNTLGDEIILMNGTTRLGMVEVGWSPIVNCIIFHATDKASADIRGAIGKIVYLEVTKPFIDFVAHVRRAMVSSQFADYRRPRLVL